MREKNKKTVISWIGQAGFVIESSSRTTVCIDPYLSNSIEKYEGKDGRRLWFPSIKYENFKPDAVFCTHDHLDHTDPETIPLIAAFSDAVFYGPEESYLHMQKMKIAPDRIRQVNIGDEYKFKDITIKPVYAKHTPGSMGFIFTIDGIKIYITGDTEPCPKLKEIKTEAPDVMITCINGKYGNLNAEEAAELASVLEVKLVIPMHYGLIPSNTVDPDEFLRLCSSKGLKAKTMIHEQRYIIEKSNGVADLKEEQ